jgi:hypothetical protein
MRKTRSYLILAAILIGCAGAAVAADAITKLQSSFVSGVLSPRMLGRVDLEKYGSGCSELTNFVVLPNGAIEKRPGLKFISETKTSATKSRLVPFQFSITQAYVLEFGAGYIRFYADGGQVVDGATPVEVSTTYTESELPYLRFAQSADVLYITHPDHKPAMLQRTSATSFTLTDVTWTWPVFNTENSGTTTLTATPKVPGSAGVVNIVFSNSTFSKGNAGLTADHVGMYLQMTHNTGSPPTAEDPGYMQILTVTSTSTGTAHVESTLPTNVAVTTWSEGSFNEVYGYPRLVTFYEDRLTFASSTDFPQRIWLSCAGDYYNFAYGTDDDDAIARSINVDQVNHIVWLKSGKKLYYGTVGGEGHLSSGSSSAVTPTSITTLMESRYGSTESVDSVLIGNETIFLQRPGKTVRRYAYDYQSDSFSGENLSILAEHLTMNTTITEMAYQQEPYGVVWCVTADGDLLGLTYMPEHKVAAWHKHTTDGDFESVCTIPGDTDDEVWVVVKRTIGGATKRYVERLEPFFTDTTTEDAFFVDSGLTYDGAAATTISGLSHLAGKTVSILGDGAVIASKVVSATGTVTLPYSASVVHVGLPYTSTMATMPIVMTDGSGTVMGKRKRISSERIKFYATHGCEVSADGITYDTVNFPLVENEVTLFTGDKDVSFPGGFDMYGKMYLRQALPLPCTVLSLMPDIIIER